MERTRCAWTGTLLLLLCLGACGGPETPLTVEICGDIAVPGAIDALRVLVLDSKRAEVRTGVRELLECPSERLTTLPQRLSFAGYDGDARLVIQGLKDGVTVLSFERRVQLVSNEEQEFRMPLTADCLGVMCPVGRTCVANECVLVPLSGDEVSCVSMEEVGGEDMGEMMAPEVDMGGDMEGPSLCPGSGEVNP